MLGRGRSPLLPHDLHRGPALLGPHAHPEISLHGAPLADYVACLDRHDPRLHRDWTFPDADGDGFVDDEDCNPNSDRRSTIVIGAIDTGVANRLFGTGCTSSDLISQLAASASNHGGFVSSVAHLTNEWVGAGLVTGREKGKIQSAAARFHSN